MPEKRSRPRGWKRRRTRTTAGLARLVGELADASHEFGTWWPEHRVTSTSYGTKHYRHPLVGELTLDCDTWDSPDGSGQRLVVLTADATSGSADSLRILLSWSAGNTESYEADTAAHND